ncbi:MAG TPA: sugar phosphate nucleotidyltransferase [Nitrospinota bacterium]|nr:sugar phosphate nucleotidyltransferase [Nitrospinota bacterium]|tara:strand:- start:18050 stop:19339 length:1290 start_codon:yes stop_codon:yes gene_type:complete
MGGMFITSNLAIILGGGRGTRLYPLTEMRCKPAVPLAGKYRLIDVPISNCIHSGLTNIYVLSQFMSASLNQHIAKAYRMDVFTNGFVTALAAAQTDSGAEDWFQGTADAVRKCLSLAHLERYKRVVILSGDQLYKMNFQELLATHLSKKADISVAVLPVKRSMVNSLGIMKIKKNRRIVEFVEKPKDSAVVEDLKINENLRVSCGIEDKNNRWLASMGIYVFESEVLREVLRDEGKIDFGKDIIPSSLTKYNTVAHLFNGYWEDIGTIQSFFNANIKLGSKNPPFDFFGSEDTKIFTKQRFLTASRFQDCHVSESVISDGCYFEKGSSVEKSVIGIRSRIGENTKVTESIIMGTDSPDRVGKVIIGKDFGICRDVVIKKAILDKNVIVGPGAKIVNKKQVVNEDGDCYFIRDGIVVIPKGTYIPAGKVI